MPVGFGSAGLGIAARRAFRMHRERTTPGGARGVRYMDTQGYLSPLFTGVVPTGDPATREGPDRRRPDRPGRPDRDRDGNRPPGGGRRPPGRRQPPGRRRNRKLGGDVRSPLSV